MFVVDYVRKVMAVDQVAGTELLSLNEKVITRELGIIKNEEKAPEKRRRKK